jgi:hypothetical protein
VSSIINPPTPEFEFGDSDIPMEPTQLRQGDSWTWARQFPNYPSNSWVLQYVLNSASNRFAFPSGSITADADGSTFDIQLSPTQTSICQPDIYDIIAILTQTGATPPQQQTIVLQSVTVLANVLTASGPIDTRSFVKKTLDTIEAAIAGDTSPQVLEYEIKGRMIRKMARIDLMKERALFKYMYDAERRAAGEYVPSRRPGIRFIATT